MALVDIGDFQHVSITVADIDRSREFYRDVLGFDDMQTRPPFQMGGYWLRRHNFILHLIGTGSAGVTEHRMPSWGAQDHVAFAVDDYDRALAQLRAAGIETIDAPARDLGLLQIYFRDPDGHVIELDARGRYPGV